MQRVWKLVLWLKERLDDQIKVLIKNSSWVLFANGIRTLLTFVKSIIIARGLGADLYGNYILIVAFVTTIQEFFNLNIGTAVIKFGADYRSARRLDKLVALVKASALVGLVALGLSLLAVAIASEVAYDTFIGVPGLEPYLLLFAVTSGTIYFNSISLGLLRLFFRFKTNSLIQIWSGVAGLVMMAGALYLYPGELEPFLVAMIIVWLLDGFVINGAAVWELRGELKGHFGASVRLIRGELKQIGGFVLSNSGSRTLKTLIDRGDVLILGALSTEQQVGFYDIAKKLAYTVLRFTDPLVSSLYPQAAALVSDRRFAELRALLRRITLGLTVPLALGFLVAILIGDWLIVRLYGMEYYGAVSLFWWHLLVAVMSAALFWSLPLVQSLGKVNARFVIMLASLALGAAAAFLLAPRYGATGVAAASLIAKTVELWGLTYVVYRIIRTDPEPVHEAEYGVQQ